MSIQRDSVLHILFVAGISALAWAPPLATGAEPAGAASNPAAWAVTGQYVRIAATALLARVNGRDVRMANLAAVGAGRQAEVVRTDSFRQLLERAINRALVMQAAQAGGIGLDAAEEEAVKAAAQEARTRAAAPYVGPHYDPESAAVFDAEQKRVEILERKLLLQAGAGELDQSDAAIRAYYDLYRADFPPLPASGPKREAAWRELEPQIRARMIHAFTSSQEARRLDMLETMRAAAQIERFVIFPDADR